jgi:hypothetical protein
MVCRDLYHFKVISGSGNSHTPRQARSSSVAGVGVSAAGRPRLLGTRDRQELTIIAPDVRLDERLELV